MLNRWNDMSELCITMYNYCFAGESKKLNICHLRCNQSVGLFSLHGGSFACFLSMSPNESPLESSRVRKARPITECAMEMSELQKEMAEMQEEQATSRQPDGYTVTLP